MTALIGAILIASLLGSAHCAGMCGAFLALAVAGGDKPVSAWRLQGAYHGGRLLTYVALGAAAGALGAAIDLGGRLAGISRMAAVAAGSLMVLFGCATMLRVIGQRLPQIPLPAAWRTLVKRGHDVAFGLPPTARAAAIGLLTTLLPCGWLYAFVITAAGTADPRLGALSMAVFWVGTLPLMIGLGIGLQHLTGAMRRHMPAMTSILLVAVGLVTVTGRLDASRAVFTAAPPPPTDAAGAVQRVQSLDAQELPCCHAH